MTDPFPSVGEEAWELRFTRRALADIGALAASDSPGDMQTIRKAATYPRIVDDFTSKRQERPDAPGDPLHSVGRPDVISLHSAAGGRAATWHDADTRVVWLLGFTAEHDYTLFEQRAASGGLLPDEDDEVQLAVVPYDDRALADVWITVHLPLEPAASEVPGWPSSDLLVTLASVIGPGDLDYSAHVPTQDGWRPLDPGAELGLVLRNVMLPTDP